MDCDLDTLRVFLTTAGCPEDDAWTTPADAPPPPAARRNLAGVLSHALGIPAIEITERTALIDLRDRIAELTDDNTLRQAATRRLRERSTEVVRSAVWTVERMRPADAFGVSASFLDIYADAYPVVDYYVPERLIALNRREEVITAVARDPSGVIGGQGAYFRGPAASPRVYEMGQVHVAQALRKGTTAFRIVETLDSLRGTIKDADAFFAEAVCTHVITQKMAARWGYCDAGIELSLTPSEAYGKEGYTGRVSCALTFVEAETGRAPLHLPASHRAVMDEILSNAPYRRDVVFSEMDQPAAEETALSAFVFDFASVERVQVFRVGRDFDGVARAIAARGDRLGLAVTQVFLNASKPGVAFAAAALRRHGFIFSAHAPRWFEDGDGFMMQRLSSPPDFESVHVWSEVGKRILAHIRHEWETRGSEP